MAKKINLKHTKEYVNSDGKRVKAEFRDIDAAKAFVEKQADNSTASTDNGKPVRVYRQSELGKGLIGRFYGSSKQSDAEDFAEQMNEVYSTLGFYEAVVR